MIIHYFKGMLLLTISTHLPLLWHIYIYLYPTLALQYPMNYPMIGPKFEAAPVLLRTSWTSMWLGHPWVLSLTGRGAHIDRNDLE